MRVKSVRESLGMGQAEFARSLRLSTIMLYYWESGRHDPSRWWRRLFEHLEEVSQSSTAKKRVVAILKESERAETEGAAFEWLSKIFEVQLSRERSHG